MDSSYDTVATPIDVIGAPMHTILRQDGPRRHALLTTVLTIVAGLAVAAFILIVRGERFRRALARSEKSETAPRRANSDLNREVEDRRKAEERVVGMQTEPTRANKLAALGQLAAAVTQIATAHAGNADAVRLQQVVDTLVRVALDAATLSSEAPLSVTFVSVNVARDASGWVMRVREADGSHKRARTDRTTDCGTSTQKEGSEAVPGLAICGEIVKEHGERLLIGTSGNLRSCFDMRLPRRIDPNAEARG